MPQFTQSKSLRIAAAVLLLAALYAMAGFWLAPKLLRNALLEQIPKTFGLQPSIGAIRFNPFLLQLEIKNFSLNQASGDKLLGFERFFIEFELSSIWRRAYTFGNIDIASPYINAVVSKDGRLNLLQLSPKSTAPKPEPGQKAGESVPPLRIRSFKVSQGLVTYDDRSRQSRFAAQLQPINFELRDFTTGVDGGRFTFTGASKLGERLEWHGHVSVQPIESDGEFRIDGLQAHTIWAYLEDRLSFLVNAGKIDLNATYKFSLRDDVDLKLEVSQVALTALAVRPKQSDSDWITVPELVVSGTTVDLLKRQAHTDSLVLSGMKLVTWLEPDGSFNLLKLAATPGAATSAASSAPVPPPADAAPLGVAPAAAAGPQWRFDLREFAVKDASISAQDRSTQPPAQVDLAPLSLKIEGASLDLGKPLTVALDTKIDATGTLKLSGQITPQPLSANLGIKLESVGLPALQPYLAQYTSMTLLAGALSGDLNVRYGSKKPTLQLGGDISVAGFDTVDNALHEKFVAWDRLDIHGLNFQHDPDRLDIDQILAHKAYARVIIEPDQSINVRRVLEGPGATVIAPSGSGGAQVAATAPTPAAPPASAEGGGKAAARARVAARAAPAASAAPATPALLPMAIKKVVLQAGQANFADLSVTPNFATGIQNLEGTVLGLSSRPGSRAKVDIHGSVDQFAPVSITGELNVLGPALYTDLTMSFRNIDLSTFIPYSGKFAGYNISKGKLTTELHYKVEGRKLDAQHHLIVDQLEFGAKTESKDAVSLPIKLAVALLKDRNGVIDLNLPVTGSLDDPKFRLGPIIWKVFINILEKAVTAPFALLGSLFGGGPDLQFIDFKPGSADLDSAAADKARAMVKALDARPQLKIDVPIGVVAELDRPRLVEAKFQAQIQAIQTARGRGNSPAAAPAFEQLDPPAQLDILTQLYKKDAGGEPKFPESIAALKTKPEITAAKIEFLNGELRQYITISEADLTALGQQRATNLQQALLTGTQIDPERVFLVANDKAKSQGGMVRLEFSLR
ncbi:MAG: DUF748 domain-containing protein [Steroidobacteraceae bacterium]